MSRKPFEISNAYYPHHSPYKWTPSFSGCMFWKASNLKKGITVSVLKKMKHNAFPWKFPICSFVAQLSPIIIVGSSRQRQTLCSAPTEPKLQLRDESLGGAAAQQHLNFMLVFLSIISNHSSFPFPGKENQRGKGTQWEKQQWNPCHLNPIHTTLNCLQSQGILNAKML